ncbi:zinc finger protein 36 family 3 protein [Cardiosporidium cionae]|uniref:Zinc finger protein 36 family 3 protein n=1 Tax=Cardiosporidium cionae TaxID=476202 RepID=A0ABQ7JDB7_9APIC|nr:zinc finger protein 36 family 3 protein [Cardiosporidium cionae]|eukprot:KAF8821990.1 zinc finger protein 36 family 3 protein [Cardiosporidium cionae]
MLVSLHHLSDRSQELPSMSAYRNGLIQSALQKLKEDQASYNLPATFRRSSNEETEAIGTTTSKSPVGVFTKLPSYQWEQEPNGKRVAPASFPSIWKAKLCFTSSFSFPYLTFFLPYLAYSALYCSRKPLSLVKSVMQDKLEMTAFSLSWIDTSFAIAYALGQILFPYYLEKTFQGDIRSPILILFSLISVTMYALAHTYSNFVFLFFWGINGLLNAPVFSLLINYMMPFIPTESRGFFFGLWITSQQTGSIISAAISAMALHYFEWRSVFRFPAFITLPIGFLVWKFLPICGDKRWRIVSKKKEKEYDEMESAPFVSSDAAEIKDDFVQKAVDASCDSNRFAREYDSSSNRVDISSTTDPLPPQTAMLSHILMEPSILLDILSVSLAYFCVKAIRYSIVNWFPLYLSDVHFFETNAIPGMIVLFDVGGIVGMIMTGFLTDTLFKGRKAYFISFSCLLTGFCGIFLVLHGGREFIPTVLFLAGLSLAGPEALLATVLCQDICEKWRLGREFSVLICGIINGVGSMGVVVQGYWTASISESYGWDSVFAVYGLVLVIASFSLYPVARERKYRHLPKPL